jgi:hypothetical protein
MSMVVDDEQTVAEAMWGGDNNWTLKVRGEERRGEDGRVSRKRLCCVAQHWLCGASTNRNEYFLHSWLMLD